MIDRKAIEERLAKVQAELDRLTAVQFRLEGARATLQDLLKESEVPAQNEQVG